MFTLQWYVTKELLKTFVLTAIGLTLVFSLGGGMFNMIRADVLTAVQLGRILAFVVPVATTLTLPVAALFSAAMVYGRLSADNEFNACRASGINVQRLLIPAIALGLFTAAFTFIFSNFVIPGFIGGLEQVVRKDLQKTVVQTLRARGYIEYAGQYVIHPDSFRVYEGKVSLVDPSKPTDDYVELLGAAFVMMEQGQLIRYGTTPRVVVRFEMPQGATDPTVFAYMTDVRLYDQPRRQFYQLGEQRLGPFPIPWRFTRKVKWMNLPELLYYREHPWELPEIEERLPHLRDLVRKYLFYQTLTDSLKSPERAYRFGTAQRGYEVRAASVPVDATSGQPRLEKPVVRQWWDGVRRTFRAGSGTIAVDRSFGDEAPSVFIKLGNDVSFADDVDPDKVIRRASVELEPLPIPQDVMERAAAITDADLLDSRRPLGLSPRIDDARVSIAEGQRGLMRKILGELHSRTAFSVSVLVLLVLGAALGIIFRGGQMLTAFAVSYTHLTLPTIYSV